MRCFACAHENRAADQFCVACGAGMEAVCARCGASAPAGARFCGSCGAALGGRSATTAPAQAPAAQADGERRWLTVLFCDLVDSTALSVRLDPEDLRDLVRAYQEVCAEVIARFGGHIAQLLGDGVLVYFGFPQAHEGDAVQAVRAALAIVAGTRNLRTPTLAGVDLAVRAGIHTGLVVVGEMGGGDRHERLALGETPNLAARLQSLAAPNSVVISAATHRLAQGFFHFDPLGLTVLKGFAEPMAVYRVLGETGVSHRLDIAAAAELSPLVGRDDELQFLLERWREAQGGSLQGVVIAGEPGIGKSRLVRVLRQRLDDAGERCTWVELRCGQLHEQSPLYPLLEHFERLLQFAPEDTVERRLAKLEAALTDYGFVPAEAMPLFAPLLSLPLPNRYPPPALSAERQKQRTLEATVEWLRREALRRPVLFVVEDLHWVDPSTLELVSLLIDEPPRAPILALLTCRPDFAPPWAFDDHLHLRTLGRLGRTQAIALARGAVGGRALPAEVEEQIVARCDGVPFYVEELTRTLLESGQVEARDDCYALTGPLQALAIPATLHDSLMARLDRLATVKDVAQTGAVIGREFSYDLIKAVVRTDDATLQQALARLVEAGLLSERGQAPASRYRFRHALLQEAAYESLLRSRRQQLHLQVAHMLEERFADLVETQPELLAHHFGAAGERERTLAYLVRAGQRAGGRYAIQEALSFYERALALAAQGTTAHDKALQERAQLLLSLFRGREAASDFASLRERARASGDQPRELEALLGLGAATYIVSLDDAGAVSGFREFYEQAYALARVLGDRARMARALIPTHLFPLYWPEYQQQAIANVDTAVALGAQIGDADLVLDGKIARLMLVSLREAEQPGEELRGLLEAKRDLPRLNDCTFRLMWLHYFRGNCERCIECCDAGVRLAGELGVAPVLYAMIKALALLDLGRYGEAWEALQREVADDAHPFGRVVQRLGAGSLLLELMAHPEAAATLGGVVEEARLLNRPLLVRWSELLRAVAGARSGHVDEAALPDLCLDPPVLSHVYVPWAAAELMLSLGRWEEALARTDVVIDLAAGDGRRPHQLAALEVKLRILLRLNRAAECISVAEEALALAALIGARPMRWRILAARAQARAILGDPQGAAEDECEVREIVQALAETITDPRLKRGFLAGASAVIALHSTPS